MNDYTGSNATRPTYATVWESYRKLGYTPLAITPGDKKPAKFSWKDITGWSEQQFAQYAAQFPGYGVGIVCEGLIVLDVDQAADHSESNKNKENGSDSLARLQQTLGTLPTTYTSTARGKDYPGRHYFFRRPEAYKGKKLHNLADHIETKTDGGYVCAWPTVHPDTGTFYVWYSPHGYECQPPNVSDLPELPSAWCDYLLIPPSKRGQKPHRETQKAVYRPQETGMCRAVENLLNAYLNDPRRNGVSHVTACDTIAALAHYAAEGHIGAPQAVETIRNHFPTIAGHHEGGEKGALAEVQRMIDGVASELNSTPHIQDPCIAEREAWLAAHSADPFAIGGQSPQEESGEPPQKSNTFSMAELMAEEFKPLEFIVPNLIATGTTILAAAPKIGKSWLCLDLAYNVATGGKALGKIPVQSRPVLYMALEDGKRRLQSRLRMLGHTTPSANLEFSIEETDPVGKALQFLDSHAGEKPLVILDTLAKVLEHYPCGKNESAYTHDYKIMGNLQQQVLKREGSLIVVHHTNKGRAGDFVDSLNGTQGLAGSADTILKINRTRGSDSGTLNVTSREAMEGEYSITFEEGRWTLDGDTLQEAAEAAQDREGTERMGKQQQEVLRLVRDHPHGIRPFQIAEETELTVQRASNCLRRLTKAGLIDNRGRGMYFPLSSTE